MPFLDRDMLDVTMLLDPEFKLRKAGYPPFTLTLTPHPHHSPSPLTLTTHLHHPPSPLTLTTHHSPLALTSHHSPSPSPSPNQVATAAGFLSTLRKKLFREEVAEPEVPLDLQKVETMLDATAARLSALESSLFAFKSDIQYRQQLGMLRGWPG